MNNIQVDRDRSKALQFVQDGRYDDALEIFELIVSRSDHPWDYLWRAHLNLLLGNHRDALSDYELVLDRDPSDRSALYHAALIYATSPVEELRNGARALQLARVANQALKSDWRILALVAASFAECGDFANAIKYANDAMVDAPQAIRERLIDRVVGYDNSEPCRLAFEDFRIDGTFSWTKSQLTAFNPIAPPDELQGQDGP